MESNLNTEIGERLRQRRKKMGLTQEKAAELLGMSATYYGEIERGNRAISIPRVVTVYERMGLTPTFLLTGQQISKNVMTGILKDCPKDKALILEQLLRDLTRLCQ